MRTVLFFSCLCFQACMLGLSVRAMIHEHLLSVTEAAVKALQIGAVLVGRWGAL